MSLQDRIKKATCRVDSDGQQLGSSFWVDENRFLTAAHVTEAADQGSISIKTFDGESIEAQVVYQDLNHDDDPGSDLALLETNAKPERYDILGINTEIPPIGTDVTWSGYARLIGEPQIERQRFGWGKIASEGYGGDSSSFFEVDGLFNPSHSGGPVVRTESGEVVGVVSASAGGFEKLEEQWTYQVSKLQELFRLHQHSPEMLFSTITYEDPELAIEAQRTFTELGLDIESDTDEQGNIMLRINTEQIPIAAGQVQAELGKLLLDTAQATFQMGVGIASGGDEIGRIPSI